MASSTYKVATFWGDSDNLQEKIKGFLTGIYSEFTRNGSNPTQNFPFPKKGREFIVLRESGNHTCRETVLRSASFFYHWVKNNIGYRGLNIKSLVFYMKESGEELSVEHKELIETLVRKLRVDYISVMSLNYGGLNDVLTFCVNKPSLDSFEISMFVLSMILWISRDTDRLKEILKILDSKIDSRSERFSPFIILSKEFITHRHWGNPSNPVLYLSMFCYLISQGNSNKLKLDETGPVNAASLCSFSNWYSYIKILPENFLKSDEMRVIVGDAANYSGASLMTFFNPYLK
jgi:hypothetical protein